MLKKIIVLILFSILNFKVVFSNEFSDLTNEINDVKSEFNSLQPSTLEEAKKIDQAVKELDEITDFAIDNLEKGDIETAVKSIDFIDSTLSDISKSIPEEVTNDLSKVDISKFEEDSISQLNKISKNLNEKKNIKVTIALTILT